VADEANKNKEVTFSLEKIYLKDVSYEAPAAPQVFLQTQTPQVSVQLGIEHATLASKEGTHEVTLTVGVTAKSGEKTVFLVEVQQCGVFQLTGLEAEALTKALQIGCAYVLLPFAREAVNDLVTKGGFPQLLLNPVNFEALYEQKKAALNQQAQRNS
jgi:preprotein translocase subunit SecB